MTETTTSSKLKTTVFAVILLFWIGFMLLVFFAAELLKLDRSRRIPMWFHKGVGKIFNIKVECEGTLASDRPTIYASNHISYLDVFVLGSVLPGSFIAKSEVSGWPLFGKLAVLGKTLFFERKTHQAAAQIKQMQEHIVDSCNLILFPEGTSTPGTHVAKFRSSLFQAADLEGATVKIQPVTVAYTHYKNQRMTQQQRDYYAWYIPMPFLSHFLSGMGLGRATAKIIFHEPVTLDQFSSRKECAKHCEQEVRKGLLAAIGETKEIHVEQYLTAVGLIK